MVVREGEVHHGTNLYLAVHGDRPLLDLMHPQDRYLWNVEYRRRIQRAEDTAVSDRERAALQLLDAELTLLSLLAKLHYVALYLGEALLVGVAHHRDDEPLLGIHRDTDVVVVLVYELAILKLGVNLGERLQSAN